MRNLCVGGTALFIFWVFVPAAVAVTETPAGSPVFAFQHYGPEQGLSSQSIQTIYQDRSGLLWIGTADGLFRYDSQRFTRWGRAEGLPSSFVFQVVEDGSGVLWVGTRLGLARRDGERFVQVHLPVESPYREIDALARDCDGSVLVGNAAGLFALRAGRLVSALPAGSVLRISALEPDCDRGELWLGADRDVYRLKQGALRKLGEAEGLPSFSRVDAIAVGTDGGVWVRSAERLLRRPPGREVFQAMDDGLPPASDYATLLLDSRGEPWLPTNVGLAHRRSGRWEILGRRNGLASSAIKAVFQDREGSLWLGNDAHGLDRWLGRDEWLAYDASAGLSHDVVWAIARGRDRSLWVGTQNGLDRLLPDGSRWQHYGETDGLGGSYVMTLAATPTGDLWVGTADGGLTRLPRLGAAQRFGEAEGLSEASITAIRLSPDGRLWVATVAGLFVADVRRATPRFARVSVSGERLDANARPYPEIFLGVLVDRAGRVWAAGRFGLAVLEAGAWRRCRRADGLRDDFTAYLAEDGRGHIWIGYRDEFGLTRLDPSAPQPSLRHFGLREGLTSEIIYLLGSDVRGRLWAGSARGVDLLEGDRFRHLGRADGMLSEDSCQNAFFAESSGAVWIGTPSGVLHAQVPWAVVARPPPPNLVLLAASLGGRTATARQAGGARTTASYSERSFAARFAAPWFRHERSLRYRYRLAGLEDSETETTVGDVRYPFLPPGSYRLIVRARAGEGSWSEPAALSAFSVERPWWLSPWALALLCGMAAAVLVLAERLRHRLLRRRNRELARLVDQRTRELREASLTDPLTAIPNRRFFEQVIHDDARRALRRRRTANAQASDLVLLLVDLDRFKSINDRLGHRAGDEVLIGAAARLRNTLRDGDLLVRWGGEEFLIVSRDTDRERGEALSVRLLQEVGWRPVTLTDGRTVDLTCSVGWAPFPWFADAPEALSVEQVVHLADGGLYAAKGSGRNRAVGVLPAAPASDESIAAVQRAQNVASSSEFRLVRTPPPSRIQGRPEAARQPLLAAGATARGAA